MFIEFGRAILGNLCRIIPNTCEFVSDLKYKPLSEVNVSNYKLFLEIICITGLTTYCIWKWKATSETSKRESLRLAAVQGNAKAQFEYGMMLLLGKGGPRDLIGAANNFKSAADQNHSGAQHNYAGMLLEGKGVPKDEVKARKFFKLAADQEGGAASQFHYAEMIRLQQGGCPYNIYEAAEYYKLSADQGFAPAQIEYGKLLLKGSGVSKNEEEAMRYLELAAAQGYELAIVTRTTI